MFSYCLFLFQCRSLLSGWEVHWKIYTGLWVGLLFVCWSTESEGPKLMSTSDLQEERKGFQTSISKLVPEMLLQVKRHITWFSRPLIPQLPLWWVRISGCSAILKSRMPDLGAGEGCQHEQSGSAEGMQYWEAGKALTCSCSPGSPHLANAPGFGISWGHIQNRFLWIQCDILQKRLHNLLTGQLHQLVWYKVVPCLQTLPPNISPAWCKERGHILHVAAHPFWGANPVYEFNPKNHKYITEAPSQDTGLNLLQSPFQGIGNITIANILLLERGIISHEPMEKIPNNFSHYGFSTCWHRSYMLQGKKHNQTKPSPKKKNPTKEGF